MADALTGGGSRSAADAQTQAAGLSMLEQKKALQQALGLQERALDQSKEMFETAIGFGEPYRDAGSTALANYESMLYGVPIEQTSAYMSVQQGREGAFQKAQADYADPSRGLPSTAKFFQPDYSKRPELSKGEYYRTVDTVYQIKDGELYSSPRTSDWSKKLQVVERDRPEMEADIFEGTDVSQPFDYQVSPSYQFRLEEGQKGIERTAAARSGLVSGRQLKAATRYGQESATLEYDNILRRIGGLVDTGAAAAGQGAQIAMGAGQQQAGILGQSAGMVQSTGQGLAEGQLQVGAARASGYLGTQEAGANVLDMAAGFFGSSFGGGGGGSGYGGSTGRTPLGYGGTFAPATAGGERASDIQWF